MSESVKHEFIATSRRYFNETASAS